MHEASRPSLLFYCQHSLGIGHLTRSFAIVDALTQYFRVVFLNGGRLPPGVPVPRDVEIVDLPPLGMDDGHTVISRGEERDVSRARELRLATILHQVKLVRPDVLLVELFPFGRKKFAGEILPLIRAVREQRASARVVCSLRDILVDARPDQQHHDDRARWLTDRYFDAVLVHADPQFARLEDSFHPSRPMRTPVHYTGFVVPARAREARASIGAHALVSAGGGIVGHDLFQAVLAARSRMAAQVPMRVIAGPFLPENHWLHLQRAARGVAGVEVLRHVPDMVAEMRAARASISQCGYNTALDIVAAGVPALLVPYETVTENEQSVRAQKLDSLGVAMHLAATQLAPESLAAKMTQLLAFRPRPAVINLEGATRTVSLLEELHQRRAEAVCLAA